MRNKEDGFPFSLDPVRNLDPTDPWNYTRTRPLSPFSPKDNKSINSSDCEQMRFFYTNKVKELCGANKESKECIESTREMESLLQQCKKI